MSEQENPTDMALLLVRLGNDERRRRTLKVKIVAREQWCSKPGQMFILKNVQVGLVAYGERELLEPPEGEPDRFVLCHPCDEDRLRRMVRESAELELVE